jgi:hypothetical protein
MGADGHVEAGGATIVYVRMDLVFPRLRGRAVAVDRRIGVSDAGMVSHLDRIYLDREARAVPCDRDHGTGDDWEVEDVGIDHVCEEPDGEFGGTGWHGHVSDHGALIVLRH